MLTFIATITSNMKVMAIEIKNLWIEEYLNEIKAYFKDIIIGSQKHNIWKIQWTIAINLISSMDTDEEWTMHSKSHDYWKSRWNY